MPVNVGTIQAVLQLRDEMSAKLNEASHNLSGFGQESVSTSTVVKASMAAAAAAVTAVAASIYELGNRGSDVDDVRAAFERMTHSMGTDATEAIAALRKGVVGTVGDYDLMIASNKLMGAGMHLTADQFGMVATAARALAKNTGKDIPEAFDLVAGALTTGRVRSLQAAGALVEIKGASAELTAQLKAEGEGMTTGADMATKRGAVMETLAQIVKQSGVSEADFKEKVDAGITSFRNWIDDLAVAVANSPVFAKMLDGIGAAFSEAFGGKQEDSIHAIVHGLEQAATIIADVGVVALQAGNVFVQVWGGIKTVVLGVETVILGLVTAVGEVLLVAEKLAVKLHIFPPEEVARIQSTQNALRQMTVGLALETAEAAKTAAGNSEATKTIDRMSGALYKIKDDMAAASSAATTHAAAATGVGGAWAGAAGGMAMASAASVAAAKAMRELTAEVESAFLHGVPMNTMIADYGDKAYKAVAASLALGGAISDVTAQMAASYMLQEAHKMETAGLTGEIKPIGASTEDQYKRELAKADEYWKAYETLQTNALKRGSDEAVAVAQQHVDLDKMRGASHAQLFADMEQVEVAKAKSGIEQENRRFELATDGVNKLSDTYRVMAEDHRQAVAQMTADYGRGVATRLEAEKGADFGQTFKAAFAALPQALLAAFQGGGDIGKTIGGLFGTHIFGPESGLTKHLTGLMSAHLGKTIGGALGTMIPGIGTLLGGMAGQLIGPLIGKISGFFAHLFGGASDQEKAGRQLTDQFAASMGSLASAADQAEIRANEAAGASAKWAETAVTVKNAYVAVGRSGEEALADVQRLFDAEKQGGGAVQKVIDEITAKMHAQESQATATAETWLGSMDTATAGVISGVDATGRAFSDVGQSAVGAAKVAASAWQMAVNSVDVSRLKQQFNFSYTSGGGTGEQSTSEGRNESHIFEGMSAAEAAAVWLADVASRGSTEQDWNRVKDQYGFAAGGIVTGPVDARIGEGGSPEMVLPLPTGGGPVYDADVHDEIRKLREDVAAMQRDQPRALAIAIRDALTLAR